MSLYKASDKPDDWQAAALEFARILKETDLEKARRKGIDAESERLAEKDRAEAIAPVREILGAMGSSNWSDHRRLYTYGMANTDGLILMMERGLIGHGNVFHAKAVFGTPEDLLKIEAATKATGNSINYNSALDYAVLPRKLTEGFFSASNLETGEQLLKMGASPTSNNELFQKLVVGGHMPAAHLLAKYGAGMGMNTEYWINWATAQSNPKYYRDFRDVHWAWGRFTAVDEQTLAESKQLPGKDTLKILFNFSSRRVSETYEVAGTKHVNQQNFSFAEYDSEALEAAREKLIALGGKPAEIRPELKGKPPLTKPSTAGLTAQK